MNLKLYIERREFIKNVLLLISGSGVAQLLVLLSSPVLTRLYTPEDLGLLGVYVSFLAILAKIGTMQYENAITLPKDNLEGANLVALTFLILSSVTCILGFIIFSFNDEITSLLRIKELSNFLYLLPISLFGIGAYRILSTYAFRRKNYKIVSKTKINQSIGMVVTHIVGALLIKGPLPLFIGDLIGRIGGSGKLFISTMKQDLSIFYKVHYLSIKNLAVRYYKFPLVSSPSNLIEQISAELPIILITVFYGASVGGWFLIIHRILAIPLVLIGASIESVFLAEASSLAHKNPKQVKVLFIKTIKSLILIIFPILCIVSSLSPWLVPIVFGSDWAAAGTHLPILAIMYFFQFITFPVGSIVVISEKHTLQLVREVLRILLIVGALYYAHLFQLSATSAIVAISIAGSIGFIIHGIISWIALDK
jgi:O-antigen/teichoic acid export membrane protein